MNAIDWKHLAQGENEFPDAFRASGDEAADTLASMIENMPVALWQVDARRPGGIFAALKQHGLEDLESYLKDNPDLVDFACDSVVIRRANRAALELLQASDERQLLKSVRYLFAESREAAARVMVSRYKRLRNHLDQFRMRRFDGKLIDVLFLVTYPDDGGSQDNTFLIALDITAQKEAEATNRRLQAELAHLSRLATLGEFGATIAHEVRQPLAAISAYGSALIKRLETEEPDLVRIAQVAEKILESAGEAGKVVERIQVLARKSDCDFVRLEIGEVIEAALSLLSNEFATRNVRLEIIRPPEAHLNGDRTRLTQLLVNLLLNALQALDSRTSGSRHVRLCVTPEKAKLMLCVEDNGPGIDSALAERIFDGFVTSRRDGMGLGLAICRSVVEEMKGTLSAGRSPLGGARFEAVFPRSV